MTYDEACEEAGLYTLGPGATMVAEPAPATGGFIHMEHGKVEHW